MNNSKLYSSSINSNLSSSRNFTSPPFQEGAIIRTVPVHCVHWAAKAKEHPALSPDAHLLSMLNKLFLKNSPTRCVFYFFIRVRRAMRTRENTVVVRVMPADMLAANSRA